jgi:hypothetical protein
MARHQIRIHGDNILECESALKLLATSLNGGTFRLKSGPAYAPIYKLESDKKEYFEVQLFPGYGRWRFPLAEYIASLGGTLREAPDAIITRIETRDNKDYELPILALEFSGALPAGNNAWQRTGRAYALAHAGIPYLYFAELGGQELDSSRTIKAARFPNPLVPFAYAVLGMNSGSISLPVYTPSPSSNDKLAKIFNGCFSTSESVELVRGIILSKDINVPRKTIEQKVLKAIEVLSLQRKRDDILKPKEWVELYSKQSGSEKARWLIKRAMPWNKKTGLKTLTVSFKDLLKIAKLSGAVAIGSKDMPICLIPNDKRRDFALRVHTLYKGKVSKDFLAWLGNDSNPLICVWVAGFKPRGDDSRPDRGLVPLARMIFGTKDIDLLTVVYGPAIPKTWEILKTDMFRLATTNGLWEAIINLSNGIIIDSSTSKQLSNIGFLVNKEKTMSKNRLLPAALDQPIFGEHDIDSVLHLLFSSPSSCHDVYECMCNPPGGDWSGINILKTTGGKVELRWTSLPRVSGAVSKRPDHLIQLLNEQTLFSIESKDIASNLEEDIGPRLNEYTRALLTSSPTAIRKFGSDVWKQYKGGKVKGFRPISGGAFRYKNVSDLNGTLIKAKVDVVFGLEFLPDNKNVVIHILANERGGKIVRIVKKLALNLKDIVSVQIH